MGSLYKKVGKYYIRRPRGRSGKIFGPLDRKCGRILGALDNKHA